MTEELKPCPFCGDGTDMRVIDQQGIAWVSCSACGTEGPAWDTAEQAATAWNRRTSPTLIPLPVIDGSLLGEGK